MAKLPDALLPGRVAAVGIKASLKSGNIGESPAVGHERSRTFVIAVVPERKCALREVKSLALQPMNDRIA